MMSAASWPEDSVPSQRTPSFPITATLEISLVNVVSTLIRIAAEGAVKDERLIAVGSDALVAKIETILFS